MTPKEKANNEILKKRLNLFNNRIGTSHWPHDVKEIYEHTKMINKKRDIIIKELKFKDDLIITDEIKKLIN
jgi:hypothetical protein